jgi:hypothetical protein
LQSIGIIILIGILLGRNNAPNTNLPPEQQKLPQQNYTTKTHLSTPPKTNIALNENQIRQIVRSEVLAALASTQQNENITNKKQKETNITEEELEEAKVLVANDINYYIGNGEISPVQMSDLQEKIARLDLKSRKQMFAKLVSAMNSGQIEGQL